MLFAYFTKNALALCLGFFPQDDNVIAYRQKKECGQQKEHCLRLKCLLVLFGLCVSSDQHSWSVKKLLLQAIVLPDFSKGSHCINKNYTRITLDFVNATLPQCAQTDMKELCFPHRDTSNPHIMENRFPGALRQLRRLTRLNVCPNYTISYNVESG